MSQIKGTICKTNIFFFCLHCCTTQRCFSLAFLSPRQAEKELQQRKQCLQRRREELKEKTKKLKVRNHFKKKLKITFWPIVVSWEEPNSTQSELFPLQDLDDVLRLKSVEVDYTTVMEKYMDLQTQESQKDNSRVDNQLQEQLKVGLVVKHTLCITTPLGCTHELYSGLLAYQLGTTITEWNLEGRRFPNSVFFRRSNNSWKRRAEFTKSQRNSCRNNMR